jgi:hypothetical protein
MENTDNVCRFQVAWIGRCKEPAVENGMCKEHAKEKCVSCGAPATRTCEETGQFVCGAPLCDNCEHTIATDGTNGNIGFYRSAPLPEGMHEHCKKTEQKEFSWLVRSIAKDNPKVKAIYRKFKKGKLSYLEADKQITEIVIEENKEEKQKENGVY